MRFVYNYPIPEFVIDQLKIRIFKIDRELVKKIPYDSGCGAGPSLLAGFDPFSGSGTNSSLSLGGKIIFPVSQSCFACSIRSLLEDTKFHQIKRSPKGS